MDDDSLKMYLIYQVLTQLVFHLVIVIRWTGESIAEWLK